MASKARNAVQIQITDRGVIKALNRSARGVRPAARVAMNEAGVIVRDDMRRRITAHGKVDTGAYRESIGYTISDRRGNLMLEVGPSVDNDLLGGVLEFGRRPGARMPPAGVLLPWMARHGIPEDREFVVRRAIGRRGLQGQPFPHIAVALDANIDAVGSAFDRVADAVVNAYNSG